MIIKIKEESRKTVGFVTDTEHVRYITTDVLNYFKSVSNHNMEGIRKDGIHFYQVPTYNDICNGVNKIKTIYLRGDKSGGISDFFNRYTGSSSILDWHPIYNHYPETIDIIEIMAKFSNGRDKILAQYCPKYNYLLLCDLPHDRRGAEGLFNGYLWNVIKEELGLIPLKMEKTITVDKKKEKYKEIIAATIGADPEFEVCDKYNNFIEADRIISNHSGEIGRDGNSFVAEFRPACHVTGKGLTENLKNLIRRFSDENNGYHLKVSGDNQAIGSHIHLGIKDRLHNNGIYTYDDITKKIFPIYKDILNTIYNTNGMRRGVYASDNPFEIKTYGFEYRSTPASIHLIPELYSLYSQVFKVLFNIKSEADYNIALDIAKPVLSVFGNSWYKLKHLYVDEVWLNKKLTGSDIEHVITFRKPNFTFGDEWLPKVQQLILDSMIDIKSPYDIHLYGLRQKRGIIFSTEMLTRRLHHPTFEPDNMRINIGLPHSFRFMTAELIGNNWIRVIKDIIISTIKSTIDNQKSSNNIKDQYFDYKDINNTLIDIRGMADTAYDDLSTKFASLM